MNIEDLSQINDMETQRHEKIYEERHAKHPGVIFFTYLFKVSAFFIYTFCNLFSDAFIIIFVTLVILLSCDFWVVKNVSGRKLVGLRWWNTIDEDGTSHWHFESKDNSKKLNSIDWLAFWSQIYITPIVWLIIGSILAGFSPQWIVIVCIAITMSCTNLIGYWKCRRNAGKDLRKFLTMKATKMVADDPSILSNIV